MADQEDRAAVVEQVAFEPVDGREVEVVGRLVEQEQVGLGDQQLREREARPLAARKGGDVLLPDRLFEADAVEGAFELVAPRVAARQFEVVLAGGDSSSADSIFVDVSMIGRVQAGRAVRRSGAKAGDGIYVTGKLGSSVLGFERLKQGMRNDDAVKRHLFPEPRYRVGSLVADKAHAMIDVSDGLSTDLTHVLEESGVSARIYKDRIPIWPGAEDRHALNGGEEYELVIVAPELPAIVEDVPLTRIGEIVASGSEHQAILIDGTTESILRPQGWQHFGQ